MAGAGLDYSQDGIEALLSQGKSVMVRGGAGCGKTHALVETILGLSNSHAKDNIACITYTNAAADEVRKRAHTERVCASTIHAFLWGLLAQFQEELKQCFRDCLSDERISTIKLREDDAESSIDLSKGVSYEDYPDASRGIVSHDGVIDLAVRMFERYEKLSRLVADCYPYIFVDEYQDTNPKVMQILFDYLQPHGATIALFGDAMQSIYDGSVGGADELLKGNKVVLLTINQNRRNPLTVISVANKLRADVDGIKQEPSNDSYATNMVGGQPKEGTARLVFTPDGCSIEEILHSDFCRGWEKEDTKILCLTHNLISREAGFESIMSFYSGDRVIKLVREALKRHAELPQNMPLKELLSEGYSQLDEEEIADYLNTAGLDAASRSLVMEMPLSGILGRYQFWGDKLYNSIDADGFSPDWDWCTYTLKRVFNIVRAYKQQDYAELLACCGHLIGAQGSKTKVLSALKGLAVMCDETSHATAKRILDVSLESGLLPKETARIQAFKSDNPYAYEMLTSIQFREFENFFNYIDESLPYSTQHKVKGLEFPNVLIVLDSGKWNKYDFGYVIDRDAERTLTASKKKSFSSKEERSRKLLYVGCTRAMDNLLVCAGKSMDKGGFRAGAEELFGKQNVVDL
jgi:DNA helicase-2/ATP-dependent DNA helicase PcrA